MFACSACTRRLSNAFLHRIPAAANSLIVPSRAIATTSTRRQNQSSAADNQIQDDIGIPKRNSNRPTRQKTPAKLHRAAKKELEWINDPYHIAENVRGKLKNDDFEMALHLTREASNGDQVVVSWNFLIEYLFSQQKLHAAIKLFNEMKKRAQLPNAQTYTMIFSGLAKSDHPKLAVAEALKIYNAMIHSQRIKPNTTHLNAVLDVCAKAQDIESLFLTLRTSTTDRPPDNRTYTIILNALRYQQSNFKDPSSGLTEKEEAVAMDKSQKQTISRAKLVWEEVMARWRQNEIEMDEELMCAMGRILLFGGTRETETIITMVTEILGITKLKDGQPGLMPGVEPKKDLSNDKMVQAEDKKKPNEAGNSIESVQCESSVTTPSIKSAKTVRNVGKPQTLISTPVQRFAANNTLSLLMRALANSRLTKLGARYWDYLTTIYGVVPDKNNYRDYLDCLFTGAASGKAARVIASIPSDIIGGGMVRRALLMCRFDHYNSQAFHNANTILDAMARNMRYPDPRCLKVYLDVALKAEHKFADKTRYPTQQDRNLGYGTQLFAAIDRIWELLRLAINHTGFANGPLSAAAASPEEKSLRSYPERTMLIEVVETAQGVCDKMLSQRLLPLKSAEHKITVARRQVLNQNATRLYQQTRDHGRAGKVRVEPDFAAPMERRQ